MLNASIKSVNYNYDDGKNNDNKNICIIRNYFKHNKEVSFNCVNNEFIKVNSKNSNQDRLRQVLETFLKDFFRKKSLRPNQYEIILNILNRENTIGLLPTSGGKSICYQLSALLSPGVTLVVDPLVSLIQDQQEGLKNYFRIDKCCSISYANPTDLLLSRNFFIFITPERFQRNGFRTGIRDAMAASIKINFLVVDEAHCVSM
jgi:ATP-dependent DNA helicase RecQ